MNHLFRQLWWHDEGQDIAEYAVMLAVILVVVPLVGLGGIVLPARSSVGRENRGASIEIEGYVALQMNGVTKISAGGKVKSPSTGGCYDLNSAINRRRVDAGSVTFCAEASDILKSLRIRCRWPADRHLLPLQSRHGAYRSSCDPSPRQLQEPPASILAV